MCIERCVYVQIERLYLASSSLGSEQVHDLDPESVAALPAAAHELFALTKRAAPFWPCQNGSKNVFLFLEATPETTLNGHFVEGA